MLLPAVWLRGDEGAGAFVSPVGYPQVVAADILPGRIRLPASSLLNDPGGVAQQRAVALDRGDQDREAADQVLPAGSGYGASVRERQAGRDRYSRGAPLG